MDNGSDNRDFNGGEWWQQWPPPPGADDDYYEGFASDEQPFDGTDITQPPTYAAADETLPGQYDEDFANALDYLTDIENVEALNIRGLAFEDVYEAVEWLQQLGLLGISKVVESGGLYYPVIGEYEAGPEDDNGDDEQDWDFDGEPY